MTRLSSHLPHLPRLCRLDRLSVRSKRLAAVLAAVLLTLSLVTLPLFAAANHLDGFLRWAYNSWNRNPFEKTDFGNWPAGDCYLVYPGNLSSLRFEKLRDGLEEFEKVNILRSRAAKNPKAKAAVARMDEELSKLFTVEKSRGDSHEDDVRKAREIIRKTAEATR